MTNNNDFNDWTTRIEQEDKTSIDVLIEHKIKTLRRTKYLRWAAIPLTSVLSIVIAFALLVNLSDVFYVYALSNPILKPLTQLVNGRQDILSAFNSGYVQMIDQSITVGDYTLVVNSIISDSRTINMFYKIKYQGEWLPENDEEQGSPFDFLTLNGDRFISGYALTHYENYRWAEVYLDTLNVYQPFVIRFTPYGKDSTQVANMTITIDSTKVIQPIIIPINQTIVVSGQKLILQSLEMGAFQSRLMYYQDPDNAMLVNLINFKGESGSMFTSSEDAALKIEFGGFPIGQLNHQKTMSFELINAFVLDRTFDTVTFDPKTKTFADLPQHLTLVDVQVDGNNYDLTLEQADNSVINNFLSPRSSNIVDGTYWVSSSNQIHIGFTLANSQPVMFHVVGGTKVIDLPAPIIIKIP